MSAPTGAGNRLFEPRRFAVVATLTMATTATGLVIPVPAWLAAGIALVVIAVLGIPHGALDYAIATGRNTARRSRFVLSYLGALVAMGLAWLAAPQLALAGFLVMSIHHFGQSDLAYLQMTSPRQVLLQWSRGILVVGLPLVAHLHDVAPVVAQLGAPDPTAWAWLAGHQAAWCSAIIGQQLAVLLLCSRQMANGIGFEVTAVALLSTLFVIADPLIAFAVYFGLWHAHAHLLVVAEQLGESERPIRSALRRSAPVSIVALAAMVIASAVLLGRGRPDLIVPMAFVALSMLTVPHLAVVEQLWRRPLRSTPANSTADLEFASVRK
ncbi:MAG: beta-carotene 15,15'-dioxygenase, Brp/Blh family [Ilumatobacteraceae bacterium]|nr:beta-carotene 15,15'-dioxygenase, Brp/Blh family [Ilumatobacteraceae bacterium]